MTLLPGENWGQWGTGEGGTYFSFYTCLYRLDLPQCAHSLPVPQIHGVILNIRIVYMIANLVFRMAIKKQRQSTSPKFALFHRKATDPHAQRRTQVSADERGARS